MRSVFSLIALMVISASFIGCAGRCAVKPNEQVMLFPSYAHQTADKKAWTAPVHGWIYEPKPGNSRAIALMRLLMRIPGKEQQTINFEDRARWFFVENKEGRKVPVQVGDKKFKLAESDDTGHFQHAISVPNEVIQKQSTDKGWARYETAPCGKGEPGFAGDLQLVPDEGLSVISTIDKTLTVSRDGAVPVLSSIFFDDLEAVPGMSSLYSQWQAAGAQFHYISPTPWQLYPTLSRFVANQGFPKGSMEFKQVRWKGAAMKDGLGLVDAFMDLFDSPTSFQSDAIETMLTTFPKRRFILVGNSKDQDPEVFGTIARNHPQQIEKIYIREAALQQDPERFNNAFRSVPSDKWVVFSDPAKVQM